MRSVAPSDRFDDLVVAIRAKSVGDEVTMKVRRDSREISVRMVLQGTTDE